MYRPKPWSRHFKGARTSKSPPAESRTWPIDAQNIPRRTSESAGGAGNIYLSQHKITWQHKSESIVLSPDTKAGLLAAFRECLALVGWKCTLWRFSLGHMISTTTYSLSLLFVLAAMQAVISWYSIAMSPLNHCLGASTAHLQVYRSGRCTNDPLRPPSCPHSCFFGMFPSRKKTMHQIQDTQPTDVRKHGPEPLNSKS